MTLPETDWHLPDEMKRRVDRFNLQLTKVASLYDIVLDAVKLGLLMTAVGWVISERSGIATPWLAAFGGCVAGSWLSMKVMPHVVHLCELEQATSRSEYMAKLRLAIMLTALIALVASLPLYLGVWVGIEQLRKI